MDEEVRRYVAGIAAEYQELFGRVNGLILGAYPEAEVKLSYRIPSYWVGKRRLYAGVWKTRGCRSTGGRRAGKRSSSHGTQSSRQVRARFQIRLGDAAGLRDDELLELVRAALGGDDGDQ